MTSPFVKDDPKLVILLSYQRSGSTFVGEWFNNNLDVFYNFEPVDSLYSAMYGTPQNANVPSDITNYPNGSSRYVSTVDSLLSRNAVNQSINHSINQTINQSINQPANQSINPSIFVYLMGMNIATVIDAIGIYMA